jgi:hypothetical protein
MYNPKTKKINSVSQTNDRLRRFHLNLSAQLMIFIIMAVLISVFLSNCSSRKHVLSEPKPPVTVSKVIWVNQVCSALFANYNAVNEATNNYKSNFNASEQLTVAQQNLVSFLSQVEAAYLALLNQITALKPPEVSNGSNLNSQLEVATHNAYDSVNAAIVLAQNLPTNNVSSFHDQAAELSKLLNSALTKANNTIIKIQTDSGNSTLIKLFATNKSCPG